jgi:uncharacterized protein YxjI
VPLPTAERERLLATIESSDRFLIQQVFRPLVNEYRISVPAPGSTEEGEPLLWVRQKRMKIKEDIRFRLDPERDEHLFMIKSKSVFEFRGRHDVLDDRGEAIGLLEKDFTRSLLRSHWHVRDTSGTELFESYEQSWLIALVRRLADNIGDFAAPLAYLPFNFAIVRDGDRVGSYRRVLGKLRDRYVLELDDALEGVDRRLLLAFTVALDALQDR